MLNDLGVQIDTGSLGETKTFDVLMNLIKAKNTKLLIVSITSITLSLIAAILIYATNNSDNEKNKITLKSEHPDVQHTKKQDSIFNKTAKPQLAKRPRMNRQDHDTIPSFHDKSLSIKLKPASYIIPKDNALKLSQFEIYGIESAYIKTLAGVGGVNAGKKYTTYELDPSYSESNTLSTNPIFYIALKNTNNVSMAIKKIIYRVKKLDQVKGGVSNALMPAVEYRHTIKWKIGDQVADLTPVFTIPPKSYGSFMLELNTDKKDTGLCWLMNVYFITDDEKGISTGDFQVIMTGPN